MEHTKEKLKADLIKKQPPKSDLNPARHTPTSPNCYNSIMKNGSLTDENISLIIQTLRPLDPILIYVFGSMATKRTHTDSDVDVAYLSEKELTSYENFELGQKLADILGSEVDLISLKEASTVLRSQVVATGKLIYQKDEGSKHRFEMYTFSDYARLNEERKPVLERIQRDGNIYGV